MNTFMVNKVNNATIVYCFRFCFMCFQLSGILTSKLLIAAILIGLSPCYGMNMEYTIRQLFLNGQDYTQCK